MKPAAAEAQAVPLRVGRTKHTTADVDAPLRVLSLTGGGYRGLFTAQVLVELCDLARRQTRLDAAIDVFAGTSIGGLMACALALGVAPRRVLDALDAHGPSVFPPKRQRTLRRALYGSLYDAKNLAAAIDDCLGRDNAGLRLKDVKTGLIVPAVDWTRGRCVLFMSAFFGRRLASDATLRDVCLATAAAPTYFDAHTLDGMPMLDGGLVANNPDAVALLEIARRLPHKLSRVEMLSLGTASADSPRRARDANRAGAAWAQNGMTFMIDLQERCAAMQAQHVLGTRYLRVNHMPARGHPAFDNMDVVTEHTRQALLDAGVATARLAFKDHRAFIARILRDRRSG